ncbi:MAG TPA: DUF3040 domain-containing protein [Actinomycetota bacterium]|nr:DUF3040 domain-containing protein [Actinomycetota bacterium]
MPLSEDEQRILEQIEKGLHEEDPNFGRTANRKATHFLDRFGRLRAGLLCLACGLIALAPFFLGRWVPAGVAAFSLMVAGIVLLAGVASDSLRGAGSRRVGRERMQGVVDRFQERLRDRYKNT